MKTQKAERQKEKKCPNSVRLTIAISQVQGDTEKQLGGFRRLVQISGLQTGLPIFSLKASPPPRDTHVSWAKKVRLKTPTAKKGTPVQSTCRFLQTCPARIAGFCGMLGIPGADKPRAILGQVVLEKIGNRSRFLRGFLRKKVLAGSSSSELVPPFCLFCFFVFITIIAKPRG